MCRFLLVRSKEKIKPQKLLEQFSDMCEISHAPDGDWQGDGWGIAIQSQKSKVKNQKWETYKSLIPIWEDREKFLDFLDASVFVVHARSAGFPQHRGFIEYNQPYTDDSFCYVFNGMLRGVNLSIPLEGKIGAQKIFSLIRKLKQKEEKDYKAVLSSVDRLLLENSKSIEGMNIGISDGDTFSALCEYRENASYFSLYYQNEDGLSMISSLSFGSYNWKTMQKGEILTL